MKQPFTISLFCHAALIMAALFIVPAPPAFKVKEPVPIVVDISTISDKVQQTATTKAEVPDTPDPPAPKETKIEKPARPEPKVAEKLNTAAHEQTAPPPDPDTLPDPPKLKPPVPDTKALDQLMADDAAKEAEVQKKLDNQKKLDDKKKADDIKQAEEKKKADQKNKRDKAIADAQALLNKIAGDAAAPPAPSDKKGAPKHADKLAAGSDATATATIVSALVSKVKTCFNIPAAAREVKVSVPIHFALNPDGSLSGPPDVQGGSEDPVFQATALAAISAIAECAPYNNLPADKYDQWKDNVIDFNPTHLSG